MSIMFPATLIQYNGLHKHTSLKDFCALELPPSREYKSFFTSVFRETRFLKVGVPVSRPAILPEAVTRKLLLDEAKGPANLTSRWAKPVSSLTRAISASACCCLSSSFFFLSSCFLLRTLRVSILSHGREGSDYTRRNAALNQVRAGTVWSRAQECP